MAAHELASAAAYAISGRLAAAASEDSTAVARRLARTSASGSAPELPDEIRDSCSTGPAAAHTSCAWPDGFDLQTG